MEKFICEGVAVPLADLSKHPYKYFALLNETNPLNPKKDSNSEEDDNADEDWVPQYDFSKVCRVQVRCATKVYGFEAYDYECKVCPLCFPCSIFDFKRFNLI